MFEPIRGGTRGGQGEFKWSDVSADKDREVRTNLVYTFRGTLSHVLALPRPQHQCTNWKMAKEQGCPLVQ